MKLRLHSSTHVRSVMPTVSRSTTLPLRFLTLGDHYSFGICSVGRGSVSLLRHDNSTLPSYLGGPGFDPVPEQCQDPNYEYPRIPAEKSLFDCRQWQVICLFFGAVDPNRHLSVYPVGSSCSSLGRKAIDVQHCHLASS